MSSQPPFDPSQPPASSLPYGASSEYIPIDTPPFNPPGYPYPPMQPPAYLYPLPSSYVVPAPGRWPGRGLALAGLLVGICSTLLWFLPCLGYLLAVAGVSLSILGWRAHERKWMAMVGFAFSLAALLLGLCNSALGAALFPYAATFPSRIPRLFF